MNWWKIAFWLTNAVWGILFFFKNGINNFIINQIQRKQDRKECEKNTLIKIKHILTDSRIYLNKIDSLPARNTDERIKIEHACEKFKELLQKLEDIVDYPNQIKTNLRDFRIEASELVTEIINKKSYDMLSLHFDGRPANRRIKQTIK